MEGLLLPGSMPILSLAATLVKHICMRAVWPNRRKNRKGREGGPVQSEKAFWRRTPNQDLKY